MGCPCSFRQRMSNVVTMSLFTLIKYKGVCVDIPRTAVENQPWKWALRDWDSPGKV